MEYGVVVHGGAGSFAASSQKELAKRRLYLGRSASAGFDVLKRGGSATDAVEVAINVLEDSGVFNSGLGSCLSMTGEVLMDAAIMNGDLGCGAIGDCNATVNPISLARKVMEKSDHVLIVGTEHLAQFARSIGFPVSSVSPSRLRRSQYQKYLNLVSDRKIKEWPRNLRLAPNYLSGQMNFDKNDTVGAVAIDRRRRVCAGVSTGGRWLKLPGRLGDSALIGAGLYADQGAGAASATGAGEEIIRTNLCKTVCDLMKLGADAQSACDAAISILSESRGIGTAGVIAIDRLGRFGAARNTEVMTRAFRFSAMKRTVVAFLPQESNPPVSSANGSRKPLRF